MEWKIWKVYDKVLKIIAVNYADLVKLCFGKEVEIIRTIEIKPILAESEVDHVCEIKAYNKKATLHFEFQSYPESELPSKVMVRHSAILSGQKLTNLISIVIFLKKDSYKTFPDEYRSEFLGMHNSFKYEIIKLWEYKNDIENGKYISLAPFLILYEKPSLEVIEKEKAIIEKGTRPKKEKLA
jgi:hypothetical protein